MAFATFYIFGKRLHIRVTEGTYCIRHTLRTLCKPGSDLLPLEKRMVIKLNTEIGKSLKIKRVPSSIGLGYGISSGQYIIFLPQKWYYKCFKGESCWMHVIICSIMCPFVCMVEVSWGRSVWDTAVMQGVDSIDSHLIQYRCTSGKLTKETFCNDVFCCLNVPISIQLRIP